MLLQCCTVTCRGQEACEQALAVPEVKTLTCRFSSDAALELLGDGYLDATKTLRQFYDLFVCQLSHSGALAFGAKALPNFP